MGYLRIHIYKVTWIHVYTYVYYNAAAVEVMPEEGELLREEGHHRVSSVKVRDFW
jgi:hypothetical protein